MHQVPSIQWDLNADDAFEAVDDLMQFLDANPDGAIEATEAGHCSIPRVPSTQWNLRLNRRGLRGEARWRYSIRAAGRGHSSMCLEGAARLLSVAWRWPLLGPGQGVGES
jgi:hypothetical protein